MNASPTRAAGADGPPRRRFLAGALAALGLGALLGRAEEAVAAPAGAQPYIGEIMLFAGNFAPLDWQLCDGSLLPIAEYSALFFLIGTTYGGDGASTFAVPDLRGRLALGSGQGPGLSPRTLGERAGEEWHTLTLNEIPNHAHASYGQGTAATLASAANAVPALRPASPSLGASSPVVLMNSARIGPAGGSQSHLNLSPVLTLNFCICLNGIFPSHP